MSDRESVRVGPKRRAARTAGGGETILLVEDEDAIRELFETGLKSKGYRVLTASDGQDALDRLAEWGKPVDLLVTDVVMPRISGPELVRRLLVDAPDLNVLYMSGYTGNAIVDYGRLDDDAPLLQKPFRKTELARAVRKVLDGPSG